MFPVNKGTTDLVEVTDNRIPGADGWWKRKALSYTSSWPACSVSVKSTSEMYVAINSTS